MANRKYHPSVYATLKAQGLSNREIARRLGVDEASVRRGLDTNERYVPAEMVADRVQLDVPIRHSVEEQGGIAVTADWHHPLSRYDLVNEFLDHAAELEIRSLAVVGDWFNMDSLSAFDNKQDAANLVRELEYSSATMERVGALFDRIYFTWGNHDARFHKVLGYKVQFKKAMRMLFEDVAPNVIDKITFTNLDHMWVATPRGPWYLAHPKTYSSVPLTNGRRLASKMLANVITGHSHHTAVGHDVSGKFVVAEIGGFFDRDQTAYLQRSTTYPNWQNGYGVIDADGRLHLRGEGWTTF